MDSEYGSVDSSISTSPSFPIWLWIAGILVFGSLMNVGYGLNVSYTFNESSKIVGGDAYNLIIIGLRGLAWICVGIVSAILALICIVIDKMKRAAI